MSNIDSLFLAQIARALEDSLISKENGVCSFNPNSLTSFRDIACRLAKFIEREGRENIHPVLSKVAEEIEKIGDDGYNDVNAFGSALYRGRGLDIIPKFPAQKSGPAVQRPKNPFGKKP
ncbi:MAG: hypothetical protein K8R48_07240 [Alphaproteobacteria bacterium]|nr:hypothetical protein [Alphaproteobacteria bacterium]